MKKKWWVLFLLISIINSCDSKRKGVTNEHSKKLTIIVKNKYKVNTNIGSGINTNGFKRINVGTKDITDTITLELNTYLKLYIKNNSFFKTVVCKKGDTLILEISKSNTKINFSNRQLKKYDTVSIENLYKLNLQKHKSKHNKLFNKFRIIDKEKHKIYSNIDYIKSNLEEFKKLNKSYDLILKTKKLLLKKLKNKQLISFPNYNNELSQLNYRHFNLLTKSYQQSLDQFYLQEVEKKYLKNKLIFNDPFFSYGYFNSYINNIILNEKESKINIDYKKVYDLLPTFLKGENLKLFREFCLHQMIENNESIYNTSKYFNNYKKQYTTNHFSKLFEKKYLLEEKQIKSDTVGLLNFNSKKTSLSEVIKSHYNKLIYIDFWASWCVPCRSEMAKSKKMVAKLKNTNIEFIYVSIDRDKDEWIKASKEEGLIAKNNYLALNYPKSNFYKELNIKSIPRYILYNKNGKIIHKDAPRPSNKKLQDFLFSSLLKE